jgi:hypothetical protein
MSMLVSMLVSVPSLMSMLVSMPSLMPPPPPMPPRPPLLLHDADDACARNRAA